MNTLSQMAAQPRPFLSELQNTLQGMGGAVNSSHSQAGSWDNQLMNQPTTLPDPSSSNSSHTEQTVPSSNSSHTEQTVLGSAVCGALGLETVTGSDLLSITPLLVTGCMSMFPGLDSGDVQEVSDAIKKISDAAKSGVMAFQQGVQLVDGIKNAIQSVGGGNGDGVSSLGTTGLSDGASGLGMGSAHPGMGGGAMVPLNINIGNQSGVSSLGTTGFSDGVSGLGMGSACPGMGGCAMPMGGATQQMHCVPLDCCGKCRMADEEQQKRCSELNKQHQERMKTVGCPGTRCKTGKLAKICRKKKAPRKCGC